MIVLLFLLVNVNQLLLTESIECRKAELLKDFNPERGFSRYTQGIASDMTPLTAELLTNWKDEGTSLVSRIFVLDQFIESDISEGFLGQIGTDLHTVRTAELKVNLRFCYSLVNSMDAPFDQVLKHIAQLKPVLQTYADIINVLEAGFIGQFGEWYYSNNFNTAPKYIPTVGQLQKRKEVLWALLDAVPSSRMIAVRSPAIKKMICGTQNLRANESFKGTNCSRIGFHNECFLADNCDQEAFANSTEKNYYAKEGLFVVSGGEVSERNSRTDNCGNVEQEITRSHISYLNHDYNPDTINYWTGRRCYDSVERSLGYRFILKDARVSPAAVKRNKNVTVSCTISNVGSAPLYNPRGVEVILRHLKTGNNVTFPQDMDPRNWAPGTSQNINLQLSLESYALATGNYEVLLSLYDPLQKTSRINRIALFPANVVTSERYNVLGKVSILFAEMPVLM